MESKLVTVVIPAYNAAQFLKQAIESVLAQTYHDYEIIVVDDGSTDETPAIVRQFGKSIRYIRQVNQGLSAARNTAIRNSNAKIIALLDADDIWENTFLEKMVDCLFHYPEAAAIYCGFRYIDVNGQVTGIPSIKVVSPDLFYKTIICEGNWLVPCAVIFQKSLAEEVGLFDEEIGPVADFDLWLKLSVKYPFYGLPEALVKYRRHGNNMSKDPERMITAKHRQVVKMFGELEEDVSAGSNWKRCAYVNLFLSGASQYLAFGDIARSAQFLRQLFRISPTLGSSMGLWRKLARAHLPQENDYPGSPIDWAQMERDIFGLLDELALERSTPDTFQGQYSRIKGSAFLALADEAGRAKKLGHVLNWLWQAICIYPRLVLVRSFWGTIARSFFASETF